MNCSTALTEIETLRWDQESPAMSDALRLHLEGCVVCQAEVANWRQFDLRIVAELQRPLPEEASRRDEITATLPTLLANSRSQRWALSGGLIAVALILLVAMGRFFWAAGPPGLLQLSAAEQSLRGITSADSLSPFDGQFSLGRSHVFENACPLKTAHGLDWDGRRGDDAAVFAFKFGRGSAPVSGYLLVMDGSRVADSALRTFPQGYGPLFVWRENGSVFMCLVQHGDPSQIPGLWKGTSA